LQEDSNNLFWRRKRGSRMRKFNSVLREELSGLEETISFDERID
jgi:hypothetical protein